MRIAVLLSLGHHPVSGRAGAARLDAQAIALANSLGGEILALHAGPDDPALADYLGHGLSRLTLLEQPAGADPVPALVTALAAFAPDLILAGRRSQGGEETGMVPYLLARALNRPIMADAAGIAMEAGHLVVEQTLPRGARRRVELSLPAVVTVHPAAPPALPFTHGALRRGTITRQAVTAPSLMPATAEERPYRRRPRLMTATTAATGKGRLLVNPAPADAAREILDFLAGIGVRRE